MNTPVLFTNTGGITIEGSKAIETWLADKVLYNQTMLVEFLLKQEKFAFIDYIQNLYEDWH